MRPFISQTLTRRKFVALGATAAATTVALDRTADAAGLAGDAKPAGVGASVSDVPTAERPDPQPNWRDFSASETALAFRCHGMQAEFLREPVTPLGAHFLLIHFDVPRLSAEEYSVAIGGRVRNPSRVSLSALKARRAVTQAVTLECAGTGRSTMQPRAIYVPWFREAIGTYQ